MLFVCAFLCNITKYVHKTLSCSCCFWSDIQKFYVTAHASPCQFPTSSGAGPCQHPQTQDTLLVDTQYLFTSTLVLCCNTIHTFTNSHTRTLPRFILKSIIHIKRPESELKIKLNRHFCCIKRLFVNQIHPPSQKIVLFR